MSPPRRLLSLEFRRPPPPALASTRAPVRAARDVARRPHLAVGPAGRLPRLRGRTRSRRATDPTGTLGGTRSYLLRRSSSPVDGRLSREVHASGGTIRLSLVDGRVSLLIRSEGLSRRQHGRPDRHPRLGRDVQLPRSGEPRRARRSYNLLAELTPASPSVSGARSQRPGHTSGVEIALGDFNGDGIPDLVPPRCSIWASATGRFRSSPIPLPASSTRAITSIRGGHFTGERSPRPGRSTDPARTL